MTKLIEVLTVLGNTLSHQMSGVSAGASIAKLTFAGHPGLPQTCRLEEDVLVSGDGPVLFTMMEHMKEAMK